VACTEIAPECTNLLFGRSENRLKDVLCGTLDKISIFWGLDKKYLTLMPAWLNMDGTCEFPIAKNFQETFDFGELITPC